MSHRTDDELLGFILGVLNESAATEIHDHVQSCRDCADRLRQLEIEIGGLRDITPAVIAPPLPRRKQHAPPGWIFKAAALLLIGFLSGFGASQLTSPQPVTVVPQYSVPHAYPDTVAGYVAFQPVDIVAGVP